ncbi:SU10 major capsid protein [Salibacterium aidingense]|uniref:SU10 major capsid protein n=1 Tax=Salibacterium aidingense TaxID=384933 RepID=UPI003BBEF357
MPVQSYDFQDQVRDLAEGISLIVGDQPSLLSLIGFSTEPVTQTKFEWMSDNLNSNIATADASATDSDTTITLAEGDGDKFRVHALVVNGDEYMQVTAIDGDEITVTRGFDGTTAESIDAGGEIRIVARPQTEAAGPGSDESHDRLVDHNYTQIFERYAAVSGTQQSVRTYNVSNELNYQVQLRLAEMTREMNDALIYGRRIEGGRNTPRMTGGLLPFSNIKNSAKENLDGGEIAAGDLNSLMEKMYQRGGNANTILTNTAGARQISKLNQDKIRIERQDTTTGNYVASFVGDLVGGEVATIVVDKNMPKDKVVVFDRNILTMHPLSGRSVWDEDATTPGADYVSRQIRGEYGVKIMNANEKVGVLENVSTSVSS